MAPASPITPRGSLEAARSEGGMPGNMSPGQSRTGSLLGPAGSDALGIKPGTGPSMEEVLLRESRKTEARTAYVKPRLFPFFLATPTTH